MMELSKRLQAVANLVTAGYKLADIGTDHAYIPIYLVENEKVPDAIAMDINAGPLKRAEKHVKEEGLDGKISLRLSNGLGRLAPNEAESAVIAGMGGGLAIKILKDNWEITLSLKECILQPQSEIAKVRTFLLEEGFFFIKEDMVLEDGKYYPMMKVKPPSDTKNGRDIWTETEIRYGKCLLLERNPVLKQFLQKEIAIKEELLGKLKAQNSQRSQQRMEELEQELAYARKGMEYYAL